jgi:hypothetical protein
MTFAYYDELEIADPDAAKIKGMFVHPAQVAEIGRIRSLAGFVRGDPGG